MPMIPGYWRRSYKMYSNLALGLCGTVQTALVAVQQSGYELPADAKAAIGLGLAVTCYAGIILRGVDQGMEQIADVLDGSESPEQQP